MRRRLRSFAACCSSIAARARRVPLLTTRSASRRRRDEAGEGLRGVEADKIERGHGEVGIRRADDAAEAGHRLAGHRSRRPAPADEAELSGITSNLASLEVQRVVDEQATDFKQYGLDPARIEVAFKAGGKEHRLLLGQKTPTGARHLRQARRTSRASSSSRPFSRRPSTRRTFDLRDKTILKIDREKVDRVEVARRGPHGDVREAGRRLALTQPVDARADFGAVEGIVGRLNTRR